MQNVNFPAVFDLASLDGANGFALNGINDDDLCGISVSGAGDVNGDGISDVLIGALEANNGIGQSYVVFGSGTKWPATLNLSELNGINGFAINGISNNYRSGIV